MGAPCLSSLFDRLVFFLLRTDEIADEEWGTEKVSHKRGTGMLKFLEPQSDLNAVIFRCYSGPCPSVVKLHCADVCDMSRGASRIIDRS